MKSIIGIGRAAAIGALLTAVAVGSAQGNPAGAAFVPTTGVARSIDAVPFIGGALNIPPLGLDNNRPIITNQTVAGQTHIEAGLYWRLLEPQRDAWNLQVFDEMLNLSRDWNLQMVILSWVMYAPEWFKQSADYTPLQNMQTGQTIDMLSPWAPGTLAAFDHFYGELARRYQDRIDIIMFGYPGSDYGEVGMPLGSSSFLPGGIRYEFFPQDPAAWKAGYWCGDPYARADFRDRMLALYGTLGALNAAWGTSFASADAIAFPDPAARAATPLTARRRWLDFMTWFQASQTRNMTALLQIVRKHFPGTMLEIPLGYGSDLAYGTGDRTDICRAAADFAPVSIRSTHGSFNRDKPPRAYWFYKRMAPACHRLGIGFGTEPPGGDLTSDEIHRQYFEDASAGVTLIYHYFQNLHLSNDVVGDYKRVLRPQERPRADIAVLYPTTQMLLDMSHFPTWQIEVCSYDREYFDYDVTDENTIGWGWLGDYKALLHTSGTVWRASTLNAIDTWLRQGGVLIASGPDASGTIQWEDWDGDKTVCAAWQTDEDTTATQPNLCVWRVGQGRLYVINAATWQAFVPLANTALAATNATRPSDSPLAGYDGKSDLKYITDFPSGRLIYHTQTFTTDFVQRAACGVDWRQFAGRARKAPAGRPGRR